MAQQVIKRGILQSFDATTYTASVLLIEATSAFLTGIPVATHIDGTSALPNALCAVLFFDEHSPGDAVVMAVYPNGAVGVPTPPPGRIVFVPSFALVNGVTIASGTTNVYQATGVGGIPVGAKGILYDGALYSATLGAYCSIQPHLGHSTGQYDVLQAYVTGVFIRNSSVTQVDANGQIDLTAAGGGSVTMFIFPRGYVI